MPAGIDHSTHVSSLAADLGRKLEEQRSRVHAAVEQQRERLHQLETALQERFQKARDALHQAQGQYHERESLLTTRTSELKREEERLVLRNNELSKQRTQLEALVAHLEESQQSSTSHHMSLLEEVSKQLADLRHRELQISKQKSDLLIAQREVETARRIYEDRQQAMGQFEQELVAKEEALRQHEAELVEQRRELAGQMDRTRRQRVALARDLRKQRRELRNDRSTNDRSSHERSALEEDVPRIVAVPAAASAENQEQLFEARLQAALQSALHTERQQASQRDFTLARELAAAQATLSDLRQQLAETRGAGTAEMERHQQELRSRELDLVRFNDKMQLREQELKKKRTQLAAELRSKRKELLAELEQKQIEIERAAYESKNALAMKMAEAQAQTMIAHDQAEKERSLRTHLEEQLRGLAEQLEYYQNRVKDLESFEASESDDEPENSGPTAEVLDLQQRLEMALADLKAERTRNQELSAQSRRAAVAAPVAATNAMDWEARKRSLLAQLEEDYSANTPADLPVKLSIEETIRRTDEAIAARDEEIARLQLLLEEQQSRSSLDSGQLEVVLESDEIIRQEREKLLLLQEQLRDRFSQAEIDLSVERAKLARERLEMEEKLRNHLQQNSRPPVKSSPVRDAKSDPLKKQASLGGRWLARLGLSDNEEPK